MTEKEAVARGAALMDRLLPGWYKEVDLGILNMSSSVHCMLGQTFGLKAERSLAKEMYPEEWKASETVLEANYGTTAVCRGYWIASTALGSRGSHMLERLMKRLGLNNDPGAVQDLMCLEGVCKGHDNKCEWAEEIAERLAKD